MKSLKECTTIQEAAPILKGKSPSFRKVVETGFALLSHPNPTQQELGRGFIATAIQEMDDAEQPASPHDKGIKPKGSKFVKEEELSGGNQDGTSGSEQSSSNSGPTPKEGTEEPVGDLGNPEMSTENQMKEGFPQMPGQGMPGQFPGMDPMLAQQMAPQQNMPPMTTPQQIQQMQYTVKAMVGPLVKEVQELRKHAKFQQEAIKSLNTKLQESASMKNGLDLLGMKERGIPGAGMQETTPNIVSNVNIPGQPQAPARIYDRSVNLENARQRITEVDKIISASKNQTHYQ